MNPPISHINPYEQASKYREAGWLGTLPIPHKEKHPPPTDWTGHRAGYPDDKQIGEWLKLGRRNICIRLAGVDKDHEIIGIDVDHYLKGDKHKKGGDQLQELENRLGKLPDTWISSARIDGKSGIRYYRVPRGLAFRGQVDKDIECISKGYRFAVVYPSIHPDGGTYWWFPPGVLPDEAGRQRWVFGEDGLPDARLLPVLPDKWIDHLTQGKMVSADAELIDMETPPDQIVEWSRDAFWDSEGELCDKMREKLNRHKKLVEDEATSHDKLTNAHYNLTRLAAEGHLGFATALKEINEYFFDVMEKRNKRGDEIFDEIRRSYLNAIRKVKAQTDKRLEIGAEPIDPPCFKTGACGPQKDADAVAGVVDGTDPPDPLGDIPQRVLKAPGFYEMNDRGNAEHFVDNFSSSEIGPSVRFADGYGWIVWHDGNNPRWELDALGNQRMNEMWQKIRMNQQGYIDNALQPDYDQQMTRWLGPGPNPQPNGPMPGPLKAAKAKLEKWKKFVELNGNVRNTDNALKAVQSIPGVNISVNALDQNSYLLGVANGVVELDIENVRLRKPQALDYVTLNTNIAWERPSDLASRLWQDYLDTFLPDEDLQKAAQVALGHCLIGGNPEKKMIVLKGDPNTGKSTMVTAIQKALGDYAEAVNQSIFQNHKLNPILADALTKRVIVCSEFDEDDKLSASAVKRLTGGHDVIRAEKKNSNAKIEGTPQCVPILATNEVPGISGADKALQNRLYVIPFNVVPDRIRKELANAIETTCGIAVLNWLIDGYVEYRRIGKLPEHDSVREETEKFVAELDDVATFADQCLRKTSNSDNIISIPDMFRKYGSWCDDARIQQKDRLDQNRFSRRLKSLGWQTRQVRGNDGNKKYWTDVKAEAWTNNVVSMAAVAQSFRKQSD